MNTQRFTFFQRVPRVFGMPRRCPGDWLAIVFARHSFVMRIAMGWKWNGEIPDLLGFQDIWIVLQQCNNMINDWSLFYSLLTPLLLLDVNQIYLPNQGKKKFQIRVEKRSQGRKCHITVVKWYQGRKCSITVVKWYQGRKCSITVEKWYSIKVENVAPRQ